MSNPIVTENLNSGSSAWIPTLVSSTQIQAYGNVTSLDPGQTISFYVSTQVASTTYTVTIYRLGWYGGLGGCVKSTTTGRVGIAQGYWDINAQTLNNCPTAYSDATTHLLEAGWAVTDTWTVPVGACTGVYVAQFTDANGRQTHVSFVVRGNPFADYVYIRPFATDNAYNAWGGYSLYSATKAYKVSFDRPQENKFAGASNLYQYEIPGIKWLESQGYNLAYLSDVDIQTTSTLLLQYKAVLSAGHDEYWTLERRNAVTAARDAGINLAFLGANACYWQIRFEASVLGSIANRTVTCYKTGSSSGIAYSVDPIFGVDNSRETTQWRDAFLAKPESALVGIMYIGNTQTTNFAWTVSSNPSQAFLAGTGLSAGQTYGIDCVGNEWDALGPGSPASVQVIGSSAVNQGTAHTTYYSAASGAFVFASGSIAWMWALDGYRYGKANVAVVPGMQTLMSNIMAALARPKNPTGLGSFAVHI